MSRSALVTLVVAVAVYLSLSLSYLNVYPRVGEDEPWIAAAPHKLATEGVWGSDLFSGYYGMERHYYAHMPVYPLLQALIFRLAGTGVEQMRLLPVALGLVLLCIVFLVGRKIGGDRTGVLAVVLLLGMRVTAGGDATGILLLDRARINRYDIAVPVFGLLALLVLHDALRNGTGRLSFTAGALAALSSLSHLYGALWLPALGLMLWLSQGWQTVRRRTLWYLVAGFVAAWVPWLAYVATGWQDYLGQMRAVAPRFDFFNPSFYVTNALHGDGPLSLGWALRTLMALPPWRVGTWIMVIATSVGIGMMLRRAREDRNDPAVAVAVCLTLQVLLFALLLSVKTLNYMIALWPLSTLTIAWLSVRLWDHRGIAVRLTLLFLFAAVLGESALRIRHAWQLARRASPYEVFETDIARCIPSGSRILGFQHYWLGLRQYPFRTWLLPINLATPSFYGEPMTFDQAIERVNPGAILVDRYFSGMMAEAQNPASRNYQLFIGFERFKTTHRLEPRCNVRNTTYGDMQVYLVRPTSVPNAVGSAAH